MNSNSKGNNKNKKTNNKEKRQLNNKTKRGQNIHFEDAKEIPNPKNIKFLKDLTNNSYSIGTNNSFCVFKSINDILILIYADDRFSIISYNIFDFKLMNEIKNAHDNYIINFRHYLDINNYRDLVLSSDGNNIKIWNLNYLECIVNIQNIYIGGIMFSSCFLNDNENIYIVASNYKFGPIKIFDFNKQKIKEMNYSNDGIYYIDCYYDKKLAKNFIITGNDNYIKSYDYEINNIYHIYLDDNIKENHISIIVNTKEEKVKLIDSSESGNIRIWEFHSGALLNKIKFDIKLNCICLWFDQYYFIGCRDKTIKLINLEKKIIEKNLKGHDNRVVAIKNITHSKYGNCLISQNLELGKIKLWIDKKNNKY